MRFRLALAGLTMSLSACYPAPSPEQVRRDVLAERHAQGQTTAGEVGPPAWGDGWEDGVEGRVDFRAACPDASAPDCERETVQYRVAYQRKDDEWRLLDIQRGPPSK